MGVDRCDDTQPSLWHREVSLPSNLVLCLSLHLGPEQPQNFFFLLFRPYPRHMEVPRLQPPATAIATQDPSRVCELRHSSRQSWIFNPLSEARDRTCVLMDTSEIHFQ